MLIILLSYMSIINERFVYEAHMNLIIKLVLTRMLHQMWTYFFTHFNFKL